MTLGELQGHRAEKRNHTRVDKGERRDAQVWLGRERGANLGSMPEAVLFKMEEIWTSLSTKDKGEHDCKSVLGHKRVRPNGRT